VSSKAGAGDGGAYVEVGLTEGHRSSFKQFDPKAPSTLKKDMAEMVDGTPDAVVLEPTTKEM
jgi:hypothetical protein